MANIFLKDKCFQRKYIHEIFVQIKIVHRIYQRLWQLVSKLSHKKLLHDRNFDK